jgi:sigma-E factor negative regulatory protein RseA
LGKRGLALPDEEVMNTKELVRQEISAFADGEMHGQEIESTLASLCDDVCREDWEIYHQIGDLLRSSDMNVSMSPGFASSMAARLEMEPPILAPNAATQTSLVQPSDTTAQTGARNAAAKKWQPKYWLASGFGAAGLALAALLGLPQLMVTAMKAPGNDDTLIASASSNAPDIRTGSSTNSAEVTVQRTSGTPDVILRDPRIDDYLSAHHRLSPTLYSGTHYARSATFTSDSNK